MYHFIFTVYLTTNLICPYIPLYISLSHTNLSNFHVSRYIYTFPFLCTSLDFSYQYFYVYSFIYLCAYSSIHLFIHLLVTIYVFIFLSFFLTLFSYNWTRYDRCSDTQFLPPLSVCSKPCGPHPCGECLSTKH